jgi:hypothetical protein
MTAFFTSEEIQSTLRTLEGESLRRGLSLLRLVLQGAHPDDRETVAFAIQCIKLARDCTCLREWGTLTTSADVSEVFGRIDEHRARAGRYGNLLTT